MKKKQLSIFDVDRTLFNGPSTEWALKSLAKGGLLKQHTATLAKLDRMNNPDGDQVPYISAVGKVLASVIGDVPIDALQRNATEAANAWRKMVFREMEQEIGEAQQRGRILVISHGPDAFIRPFAKLIRADYAIGRSPEDFTERRKPKKLVMAATACLNAGIDFAWSNPDWETTVYGDDPNDVPLLQLATAPVLVNPMTAELREYGKAEGWRILDCAGINQYGEYGYLEGRFVA
ncbi:MAG TPA: HAD family hydrolase [Candidatus Saccharimonadales bacterium]